MDAEDAKKEYGISIIQTPETNSYDAVVLAVSHDEYLKLGVDAIRAYGKENHVLYDIKSVLPRDKVDGRL